MNMIRMMRWLFLMLVIANGGVFAFSWYERSQEKYVLPEQGGLVSERGAGIALQSEASISDLIPRITEQASLPLPEDHPASAALCIQIGPFRTRDTVGQAEQQLLASGLAAQIKSFEIQKGEDFWVLMPAMRGRNTPLGRLKELDAQGVDAFLITEGEHIGGVSLGLFSRRSAAVALKQSISDKGYVVKLEEIPRLREEYWLEISQKDSVLMSESLWKVLQSRYGFTEKHENLCGSGIASSGEVP